MFLQAQSKNQIISYLAAMTFSVHLCLSWLLTVKYKFGITGAMVSTVIAYWIPNLGQLLFVIFGGCTETWHGLSIYAFKDLWPVVKLSLSSGAMLCLEIWYNTILLLLTGSMKNAEVAIDALAICLNVNGLEMMLSLGLAAAVSVRVSNEIGRGSSKGAVFSIMVTTVTSFAIGCVLFVVFLLLKGRLAYMFIDNNEVAKAVADLSPLLAFSILLNSIQPVLSRVSVCAGWQSIVAYVNLSCYYLIGIPIGAAFGYYYHYGVKVRYPFTFFIKFALGLGASRAIFKLSSLRASFCRHRAPTNFLGIVLYRNGDTSMQVTAMPAPVLHRLALLSGTEVQRTEPESYEEAMSSKEKEKWRAAMEEEMRSLELEVSALALLSAEAKYIAIVDVFSEAFWLQGLLAESNLTEGKVIIYSDSQSAIHLSKNPVYHERTKHVDVRFHFARDLVTQGVEETVN
ncbi:protein DETOXIFICATION 21-like [Pistacia vera]|uniref:protein DETOXIFICATION 21-like n=1 Tax=Pistacia vera TaxID=55513 RepID=UPI001263AAD4|nr:protein DETOXIFICATION 21-like [Pistacia vera]